MVSPPTRLARLALSLLMLAASCHSPTAPEPPLAACSLTIPNGSLCFRPCPPGTDAWAVGAGLAYSPSYQC